MLILLQQIPIIRTQIPHLRLFKLRQPQIPRRLFPRPVLPEHTRSIDQTARRTQANERNADTVPVLEEMRFVLW